MTTIDRIIASTIVIITVMIVIVGGIYAPATTIAGQIARLLFAATN